MPEGRQEQLAADVPSSSWCGWDGAIAALPQAEEMFSHTSAGQISHKSITSFWALIFLLMENSQSEFQNCVWQLKIGQHAKKARTKNTVLETSSYF